MLVACAGESAPPSAGAGSAEEDALAEASALCSAGVNLGPGDDEALQRRMRVAAQQLRSDGVFLDEAMDEVARAHHEARSDCLAEVLPALEGEGGQAALDILRAARLSCEMDPRSTSPAELRACIHARKLEIFAARSPRDGRHERETLDRLLRVGGGAPLSLELREQYCRTRELSGTGHALCE